MASSASADDKWLRTTVPTVIEDKSKRKFRVRLWNDYAQWKWDVPTRKAFKGFDTRDEADLSADNWRRSWKEVHSSNPPLVGPPLSKSNSTATGASSSNLPQGEFNGMPAKNESVHIFILVTLNSFKWYT